MQTVYQMLKTVWSNIWDNPIEHNRGAEWLTDVRDELSQCSAQEDVKISEVDVRGQLKKVANWKGPGPDDVQGYWLMSFTTLQGRVVIQLNEVQESDSVPQWMNKRRTILCPKDPTIGNCLAEGFHRRFTITLKRNSYFRKNRKDAVKAPEAQRNIFWWTKW